MRQKDSITNRCPSPFPECVNTTTGEYLLSCRVKVNLASSVVGIEFSP